MKTIQLNDVLTNRFRKSISLIIIAAVLALISSCAVKYPVDYYHPEATGGKVVRTGQSRTQSAILFEQEGVIIGFHTSYYDEKIHARISFEVPDDKVVQLVDQNVEVKVNAATYRIVLSGSVWPEGWFSQPIDFPIFSPMIGKKAKYGSVRGFGDTRNANFFVDGSIVTKPQPEAFQVKLPRFRINNVEVNLPVIRLKRASEDVWVVVP
jgi:hypothetical protein